MADLGAGTEFAGHRIEEVIGRGGMGVVYRAIDLNLDREVAVKVIAPELAGTRTSAPASGASRALAASIEHPHVIPIYDAGEDDGLMYIAMRLHRRHRPAGAARPPAAALEPRQAAGIVAQVAGRSTRPTPPGSSTATSSPPTS